MAEYFAYLLFNLVTLLGGVAILTFGKLWPVIKWRALGLSYLTVSGGFIVWDYVATSQGHWAFNPAYTTGLKIAGVPIEELLFFFTVPFACLAVYLLFKRSLGERTMPRNLLFGIVLALIITALLAIVKIHGDYTFAVTLAFMAAIAAVWHSRKLTIHYYFWAYLAVCFGLFYVMNGFLTGLPIVTYGADAIMGIRIGTIPIEDFAYNFALLSLFVIAYEANLDNTQ